MLFGFFVCVFARVACVAASNADLLHALKFMTSGWVALPGFLPELQRPELRTKIQRAEIHARLAFVDSTYTWMEKEFLYPAATATGVSSIHIQDVCSVPSKKARDRGVSGKSLAELELVATDAIDSLKNCRDTIKSRFGNGSFPYFQSLNIHRLDHEIYGLATDKKMGRMAAILLQQPRVSLYQTAVFVQSASGGVTKGTSWHQDLNMVPLDTAHVGQVTFWCPLQPLEAADDDSILTFAMGSHRDVSYAHWFPDPQSPKQMKLILEDRYRFGRMSSMKIGDCTAHHGWVFHSAPAQARGTRAAVSFAYVSSDSRVLPDLSGNTTRNHRPFAREDELGYAAWLQEAGSRGTIKGNKYLPSVYDENSDGSGANRKRTDSEL